jgi:predicted amidohydrolase YtcJ
MLLAIFVLLHGASSLVIDDGRIVSIGAGYPKDAQIFDASGMTILPGFHDSHAHPMTGAMRLLRCHVHVASDLASCSTSGAWLQGITDVPLDLESIDKPALFTNETGFEGWANRKAGLGALHLDEKQLVEARKKIPLPTQAEYREALKRATHIANGFGITSIVDAAATPAAIEAYFAAEKANELTVRILAAQTTFDQPVVRHPKLRTDAAKIFLDGEIEFHTAAMLDGSGTPIDQAKLNALVQRLDAQDFRIHMHAMGDRAVRAGLDAIESAIRANGPRDRRHQLAHLGVVDPRDIPRFAQLGVAANFQLPWLSPHDPDFAPTQRELGNDRAYWMLPLRQVWKAGGRILTGSDWPQPSMDPLAAIDVGAAFIDRAALSTAYTSGAAWADGFDASIEPGKEADLVVLDGHKVVLTLLHGEIVYRAE